MMPRRIITKLGTNTLLVTVLILFVWMSVTGMTWGLPSRKINHFLFGDDKPWSGEKIARLAGASAKLDPAGLARRGADVDIDPLTKEPDKPTPLTASDIDVAKIYLRYRLYTYQPDEMITMMALAGMNPRKLQFDPRLYQYGGLFVYPVGALIGACGLTGWIDVRGDLVYYLDHPDAFGKFYVAARAYAAAWGLLGVVIVFALARRLGGARAGLLAALLFTLMPVVVCMSHEGKPHLPGAVLMLAAVLFAMRFLFHRWEAGAPRNTPQTGAKADTSFRRDWWWMCVCCGAAFGMVLSSWPIFALIPLTAWMDWRRRRMADHQNAAADELEKTHTMGGLVKRTAGGVAVGVLVYLVTNPYIVINALTHRAVLASNFGNSFAMYKIDRIVEGFLRVLELTAEGATLPVLILGAIACFFAIVSWGERIRVTGNNPGGSSLCEDRSMADEPHAPESTSRNGGDIPRGLKSAARARSDDGDGTEWHVLPVRWLMLPLMVPAGLFFLQFVLIGAGKPAEYGRFGIFTDTALAIAAACLLSWLRRHVRGVVYGLITMCVLTWVGWVGFLYLAGFATDSSGQGSRLYAANILGANPGYRFNRPSQPYSIAVIAEPAPYSCPPLPFQHRNVLLFKNPADVETYLQQNPRTTIAIRHVEGLPRHGFPRFKRYPRSGFPRSVWTFMLEHFQARSRARLRETPISWANKPFEIVDADKPHRSLTVR